MVGSVANKTFSCLRNVKGKHGTMWHGSSGKLLRAMTRGVILMCDGVVKY